MGLPEPECRLGYDMDQVSQILTDHFWRWMRGQTMALCEGRHHILQTNLVEGCYEPHGGIVYQHDMWRYLYGLPVID